MKEVAVLGGNQFVLGFQIAGVNKAFALNEDNPNQTVNELISNPDIGLIILEEESLQKLSEELREIVMHSIQPVFLVISEDSSNEEMRRLIKKSIGVDVWDK